MIEDVIAQSHVVLDGLIFNQGLVALSALKTIGETPGQGGAFAQLLGIQFQEIRNGRCTASLDIKDHLLNPLGIAHGGVAYSLADSASGGAALSALGAPRVVTQDMQIRYHGPARVGTLVADANVIHHGQRTITVRCLVTQEDVLLASTTATFAILSEEERATILENL
jgi:acyl-CoA thioesterase